METTPLNVEEPKLDFDSSKQICRCCLTTEKRMKNAIELQEYFMELADINVALSDGMPQWVCVECSALMQKSIAFKYKMLRAQSILCDCLMRCAPGQLNPKDPELTRYKAPYLSATRTLIFDTTQENDGFHEVLLIEKELCKTGMSNVPLLPKFENHYTALETVEASFSDFEDDPLDRPYVKIKEETVDEDATIGDGSKNYINFVPKKEPLHENYTEDMISDDSDNVKGKPVKMTKKEKKKGVKTEEIRCKVPRARRSRGGGAAGAGRGRKRYECSLCDAKFANTNGLKKHTISKHSKDPPFECERCGKGFQAKCTMRIHIKHAHEGIEKPKNKKCHICGRGFHTNFMLKNHIRVHTGEKPFRCEICLAAFSQKTSLTTHTRAVHLKVTPRPGKAKPKPDAAPKK